MARTEAGARLTREYRREQLALRASVLSDLVRLWHIVDPVNLAGTVERWSIAVGLLGTSGNRQSAALAGSYYRAFRVVEGIPGAIEMLLAEAPTTEVAAGKMRGAALRAIIDARRGGFSPAAAARRGLRSASSEMTSIVLSGSRQTLLGQVAADGHAQGWQRVTSGDPCALCRALASRGATFKSERSAEFEAHGGCSCDAEPFFEGSRLTGNSRKFKAEYDEAQRQARDAGELQRGTENDALNAYRRYLANQASAPAGGAQ